MLPLQFIKSLEKLYSAYRQFNSTTKRPDVDHIELLANTPHLPFLRIRIR